MINSILASIDRIYKKALAIAQDHCGVLQNFTKVENLTNPKLKNNPTAFSHALKNILKHDKKPG